MNTLIKDLFSRTSSISFISAERQYNMIDLGTVIPQSRHQATDNENATIKVM